MSKSELTILWVAAFFAALTGVTARLARDLYNVSIAVPDDPLERQHWERRRRWMIWSELAALPAFATISVASVLYFGLPAVAAVLLAIALGGLGFGFLLNGLQAKIREKWGIEP